PEFEIRVNFGSDAIGDYLILSERCSNLRPGLVCNMKYTRPYILSCKARCGPFLKAVCSTVEKTLPGIRRYERYGK
ncbi:uncharacterized, partial [Tachysurus ichikawai]